MNFVEELKWRGMIHDIMPGTEELLEKELQAAKVIQKNLLMPIRDSRFFRLDSFYQSAGETGGGRKA